MRQWLYCFLDDLQGYALQVIGLLIGVAVALHVYSAYKSISDYNSGPGEYQIEVASGDVKYHTQYHASSFHIIDDSTIVLSTEQGRVWLRGNWRIEEQ